VAMEAFSFFSCNKRLVFKDHSIIHDIY
jgi:hypothetical protein